MKPTNQPTSQPAIQPSSHPANIFKAQHAFGKAGHNINDIIERVHIALEWAEDVDGLERGLEGFGLDGELESWMALKKRKKASYESPPDSLLTHYCAASGMLKMQMIRLID
ncbi:uncharacterized protein Bfra_009015 [Botrytis fragariae]|uniref:Uncharacterized protein n=1 Tax=Botrytis fragariae TaxID=1964551 RepID=A0A8H6AQA9_9HELO|nr:uncharacterized protein Bfra_009015 [Botrytis fragariae]KAF5871988.1 hypothetical protein Bfra_009015 [Botrytis fragariae]